MEKLAVDERRGFFVNHDRAGYEVWPDRRPSDRLLVSEAMASDLMRWSKKWTAEDHASFEALCFHRVNEVDNPYTRLMRAPEIGQQATAAEIARRAYESTKAEIDRVWVNWDAGKPDHVDPATGKEVFVSGGQIFAYAVAKLCDSPGRVATLVSTNSPEHLDLAECNTAHERGGPLDSTFSGPFASGAVWDTYWFFENAFGPNCSVAFTTMHLTDAGVAFCLECWPERIEALRAREEERRRVR